ncbi:MAG: hypothetical protein PHW74_12100 [Desulfobacca sp.]|nr:hypothetical protein [Desulfobacca sp.]
MSKNLHLIVIVSLILGVSFCIVVGIWTDNKFFYCPDVDEYRETSYNNWDAALVRADKHIKAIKILGAQGYENFATALTNIGSTETTLVIPSGTTIPINADTTTPTNLTLVMNRGAVFSRNGGDHLTINGPFSGDLSKHFDDNTDSHDWVVFNDHAVRKVYPEWWGAVADWNPVTMDGTCDHAAIDAAVKAHSVVDLGNGQYTLKTRLVIEKDVTFITNDAAFHNPPSPTPPSGWDWVVQVLGSRGDWHSLTADADAKQNVITCPALAAVVGEGDLIFIASDKEYIAGETEVAKAGELQLVLMVAGDDIRLSGSLNDSYLTADRAKAALVAPVTFRTQGRLGIYNYPEDDSAETDGFAQFYTLNSDAKFKVHCTRRGVATYSSYAPTVDVLAENLNYIDTRNSHAIGVYDATTNARLSGIASGARHAVAMGGVSEYGIPWNIQVNNVIGQCVARSGAVTFDSHGGTGSVYWNNCIAIGGLVTDKEGTPRDASGFYFGAQYNYYKDCVYIGNSVAIKARPWSSDLELLEIDGLSYQGNMGLQLNAKRMGIKKLVVRNVNGKQNNTGYFCRICGVQPKAIEKVIITDWVWENINITGGRFLDINTGDTTKVPEVLRIKNAEVKDGVCFLRIDADATGLHKVILDNVSYYGSGELICAKYALDRVVLNNVWSVTSSGTAHCRHYAGNLGELVIQGGFYEGAATIWNLVSMGKSLDRLTVSGVRMVGGSTFADCHTTGPAHIFLGPNDASGVAAPSTNLPAGYIEYLAGTPDLPLLIRVTGTPEGAVRAPVGCMALRRDGGVGTTLYIKESGSGNTGWVAK